MIRALLCTMLLLTLAGPVRADEPPDPPKPTRPDSFGAQPDAPMPAVAPGDFEGLLKNCDIERARAVAGQKMAEKDKANMPFLTAAYLALWAILLTFFVIVAQRQKRMRAEMATLRDRLSRLDLHGQPDSVRPPASEGSAR